uniref:Torsin family 1 n=1 Tax=Sander lucioperca TaxID=283035 RepID=A0A8D0DF21_SANLU
MRERHHGLQTSEAWQLVKATLQLALSSLIAFKATDTEMAHPNELLGYVITYSIKLELSYSLSAVHSLGFKVDLESKLFGQHIASRVILKAVNGFMRDDNPKKPLVLSLHGRSGIGKNVVSRLIAAHIYKKGMDSSFVHTQLKHSNVSNCERSMFIFDAIDQMHPGLIDSIKPYLDYYDKTDGASYRKAIFIFLSNVGGESITQIALDFWKAGRDREEIELNDLEKVLSLSAFNSNNNGLWHSGLIDKNLVDFFVPFLPLEYRHVVQCVMAEMKAKGLRPDQNVANKVAKDLLYFPKSDKVFSVSGCKLICTRHHIYT